MPLSVRPADRVEIETACLWLAISKVFICFNVNCHMTLFSFLVHDTLKYKRGYYGIFIYHQIDRFWKIWQHRPGGMLLYQTQLLFIFPCSLSNCRNCARQSKAKCAIL